MMPFNSSYKFKKENTIIIRHSGNKNLRSKPGNLQTIDSNGGNGEFAQWIAKPQDHHGNTIKLQNKKTNKYLRIIENGKKIDINGNGGKYTIFKVHKDIDKHHSVKLESVAFPGKFIAVGGIIGNNVRVGMGGPFCTLKLFKNSVKCNPVKPVIIKPIGRPIKKKKPAQFTSGYKFARKNAVVIQHGIGKHLRVNPLNLKTIDSNGAKGEFAQFEADPSSNGQIVKFKSLKTGKFLRIIKQGTEIDVDGKGGKFTVFKVHKDPRDHNKIKLESAVFKGKYIAVGQNNQVRIGGGGKFCNLSIYRKD